MAYTTIDKPTDYFNTVLYTGTGSSNAITGVGHSPDFVWTKRRNSTGVHFLQNTVTGTNKALFSNDTSADFTGGVDGGTSVTSFDSDGFTVGTEGAINGSSDTFVSWNWKAGGSASSNSDGSITSSVSANTTSGFSIVTWTGTGSAGTVGHGLSSVPNLILFKNRSRGIHWVTYDSNGGAGKYLHLEDTYAYSSSTVMFNNTEPTSSVFSIGGNNQNNASSENIIAYCFAEKKGYSKFGSYTGNNSNNGPFVYLGFKPAWILFKSSDSGQHWHLIDSKRETSNDDDAAQLSPNNNSSEATVKSDRGTAKVDFLSNGFKIRSDGSSFNGTNSMIYMAFAESPFVSSGGIPTTAR